MPSRARNALPQARRSLAAVLLAATCVLGIAVGAAAGQRPVVEERAVKAAVVVNLPRFVEGRVDDATPVVIGVLEPDPFGRVLDELAAAARIDGRAVIVRRAGNPSELGRVSVLVVGREAEDRPPGAAAAAEAGVLTVGESDRFLASGGMVRLVVVVNGRVGFEVDAARAAARGVRLSSQLLRMAVSPGGARAGEDRK